MQLLAVVKAEDLRTHGWHALLTPFVQQMNLLARVCTHTYIFVHPATCTIVLYCMTCIMYCLQEEGCDILIGDGEYLTVHGAVVCMCGDTPASNFFGGFKEGVGFALRKCRICLATGGTIIDTVR